MLELEFSVSQNRSCKKTFYNAKYNYMNEYIHKSTSNYFSREIVLKMQSDFVPRNVKNIKFISCV